MFAQTRKLKSVSLRCSYSNIIPLMKLINYSYTLGADVEIEERWNAISSDHTSYIQIQFHIRIYSNSIPIKVIITRVVSYLIKRSNRAISAEQSEPGLRALKLNWRKKHAHTPRFIASEISGSQIVFIVFALPQFNSNVFAYIEDEITSLNHAPIRAADMCFSVKCNGFCTQSNWAFATLIKDLMEAQRK